MVAVKGLILDSRVLGHVLGRGAGEAEELGRECSGELDPLQEERGR